MDNILRAGYVALIAALIWFSVSKLEATETMEWFVSGRIITLTECTDSNGTVWYINLDEGIYFKADR